MTVTAQRLWLWMFSLAFIALSGFNGYRLMDLEGSPWMGEPSSVRSLRAQLDRLSSTQESTPVIEWREPYEAETHDAGPSADGGGRMEVSEVSASQDAERVIPPVLSGIVAVLDHEGRTRFRALLDGEMRDAGQRVGDFLIVRISEPGVHLRGRRGDLFLRNSDPIFSIDQGNAHLNP